MVKDTFSQVVQDLVVDLLLYIAILHLRTKRKYSGHFLRASHLELHLIPHRLLGLSESQVRAA